MLDLMKDSTTNEQQKSDDRMCHLRRSVEKALYSLCCPVSTVLKHPSHLGARPVAPSRKEVDPEIIGAAITREGLVEGLASSNRDARSRILRLVAKLVSAPANAVKLGPQIPLLTPPPNNKGTQRTFDNLVELAHSACKHGSNNKTRSDATDMLSDT